MLVALLPVMVAYCLTGRLVHECLGVGMSVVVLLHHIANPSFFRKLFCGKYNLARFLLNAMNIAILLDFLFLLVSGIFCSKFVFGWMGLRALRPDFPELFHFMRLGHVCACFWGVVFMGIHLGQHVSQMFALLKLNKLPKAPAFLLTPAVLALAARGSYVFVVNGWFDALYSPHPHIFAALELSNGEILMDICSSFVFFALIGHLLAKGAK